MILNNENKKTLRNRKRRIERGVKLDDKMKSLLNKIHNRKKRNNKNFDKIKELEIELVKIKYFNNSNLLEAKLKDLNKIQVDDENLHEIKNEILGDYTVEFELVGKLSIGDQIRETHIRFRYITD